MNARDDGVYVALDQGGHASRALIFDRGGDVLAAASVAIATQHPAADRVEHDAGELVASLQHALAQALAHIDPARPLLAAGLATQRSSVVCWDRHDGRALSPVLSWQDRRAAAWLAALRDAEPVIQRKTGLVLSPHYGAGKLRWCLDHLPAVQAALRDGRLACGPLASLLAAQLTREHHVYADPANASRTSLFDLDSADWDGELLHLFGIPAAVLPRCVPTRYDYGRLATSRGEVPLTVVTGDQAAALFGFGPPLPATVLINLGTGAFVQRPVNTQPPPSRLLTSLAYHDGVTRHYVLEGTVNGAGSALAWACAEFGLHEQEVIAQLPEWLAHETAPPLFMNGVAGLGSPYWCPALTPHFVGDGTAAARCVAVIESIVFLIYANLEMMDVLAAGAAEALVVSGGLARLDGLCQRLADLAGVQVRRPAEHEATARGLAFLTAGCPAAFRNDTAAALFMPASNPPLAARYRRWRTALEQRVAQSGH